MNNPPQNPLAVLAVLRETCSILNGALQDKDDDKAHEAVSVLLMQAIQFLGMDSPVMAHLFPPMDVIKRRIDAMDLEGALGQTELFDRQIGEIMDLIKSA
jgi:hypothetical protein